MLRPNDWLLGFGIVVVTVAAVVVADYFPLVGVILAAVLVGFLAVAVRAPATAFVFVGTLLIASSAAGPALAFIGSGALIPLRLGGAASFIAAGLLHGGTRRPVRPHSWFIGAVVAAMATYSLVATLLNTQYTAFVNYMAALAVLGACLVAMSTRVPVDALRVGLAAALSVFVSGSLVTGVLTPGVGIEQGRLRGLAENANGLGCYAFILGALAVTVVRSQVLSAALFVISAAAIIWSGSRNSALALLVVVILVAFVAHRWAVGIISVAAWIGITYVLSPSNVSLVLGRLLIDDNTRYETFSYAFRVMEIYPFTGIGLDNEATQVASSPMRALVHSGLWGGIAIAAMWVALLAYGRTGGVRGFAVALGVVVFSLFEGVLLSSMGPFLPVLLCAVTVVQRYESESCSVARLATILPSRHPTQRVFS